VANYDGAVVTLSDGTSIPAATLIWTAGVKPSRSLHQLPCEKERGRLLVSEFLAVTGVPGLWAAGDCAAVPVLTRRSFIHQRRSRLTGRSDGCEETSKLRFSVGRSSRSL